MSYGDEYLKLRAEREGTSGNNAGGAKPPASSQGKSNPSGSDSYGSEYLRLREERNNMTLLQRAEARAKEIEERQRAYNSTPEGVFRNAMRGGKGPTTSGGFYSRPEIGSARERFAGNVTALEPVLTEKSAAVNTAQTSLVQAEKDLRTVQGYLDQAKAVYDADPTNENANNYNQIVGAYNLAYDTYASAYQTYSTAYDEYKPYEDQLVNALAIYQIYEKRQQEAFDDWRGTIRDATAIQAELDALEQAGGEKEKIQAMRELLHEELNWSQYYHYADFADASDFKEMSRYVPQERKERRWMDIMLDNYSDDASGWEDPLYEYINGNEEAGAYISNAGANYYGPDNAIGSFFGRSTESKTESQQMNENEVAIFNYLYATQGKEAAHEYYNYLLADLNYRQRKADEQYWADYAAKDTVGSSIFSVAMSPTKGLSYIGQLSDYLGGGTIDQNAAYNKFSYIPSAIRGQVVKQIEDSGKWGKVGSFAYQTGLSMADFLFASALSGNNQAVVLTIMGSGAAADTTITAKDRGLTDDQALVLGTIAGLAEAGMESINMETVFKPEMLKDGIARFILKNATAEGLEEVGTDAVNLMADILIAKDQSEWQKSIDAYMKDGKSYGEAVGLAVADQAAQMGTDFLGGWISGGILSGTNAGIHVNYTNQMGNELGGLDLSEEDIQAFIETGLESAENTASHKLAMEMQQKINAGEKLSNYDLAKLYQANIQAIQEEETSEEDLPEDTITEDSQDGPAAEENTANDGLQLPTLENDTEAHQNVTQNTGIDTQAQVNDSAMQTGVPLSIAEQLRQEQNGGIQHESTQKYTAGSAATQPGGEVYLPDGTGLSDGGEERNVSPGAGEQTGILAGSPEQRRSAWADRSRATVERQNYARSLRLEKVSSLDLGLQSGTEAQNIQVFPQEHWDSDMVQLDNRIYNETGKHLTYVMGRIQIRGASGAVGYARGVITGDQIIVQADHLRVPMEQIADHEAYHAKADFTDGRLNAEIRKHIIETFSAEEFQKVLDQYIVSLRGVIDVNEARTADEFDAAVRQIEEEVFADAYAGINAFSAGADRFTDAVNQRMDQLYMGKNRDQDNGTAEPTGPPADTSAEAGGKSGQAAGERFSYAGENANNADMEALARAKEMQAAGVADETIRQQTGWHTGMDGKWRWEIDDSGMKYSSRGDLGFRERNKGYDRYRTLTEKAEAYMLGKSDTWLSEEEQQELTELQGTYGEAFREDGRTSADALPQTRLADYLKHDELFTAYPQLRNTTLRFEEMHDGTRGYYSRSDNEIVLNESLRHEPEDTLIHEIQHAIQRAEGFAQGSSPEFWEQIQKGEQPVRVNDRRVAEAERKIREILDSLPQNVADQFELHWNLEKSDPEKALELADELSEGPYGDAFSDFFLYTWEVDLAAAEENYARGAMDLYRNTAGEIEARDAAERRKLTPDERRSKDPVRADDKTVFVEDVDDAAFGELEIDFGDEADLRLGDRYFMDDTDSLGHDLTQEQQEYFAQSQARDSSGRLLVLYHQTDGDFTIFDTRHQGAGSRDSDTPFGIFLKRSAGDIGLSGKKQMALYANIANPLRAESREDLTRKLRRISDSYADTADRIKNLDAEYQEKFDHAKKAFRDFLINWRKEHPDAGRSDIYQDPKFEEVYDAEEAVLDAWTAAADRLSTEAKEAITADLRKAGYDGVFLENDIGSWGRRTDAIIALDPQQVKNVTNKKPTGNPDIRYSIDDDGADLKKREQFRIIQNHNPAPNSYSTWIRSAEECHTFGEVLEDPEWEDYDEFNPDYDRSMAQRALESGRITVYSSYPISQGVFISPSRMEAESYSGSGKVYRKTVNISDVAWIDPTQGQYAKTGSKEKRDRYSVDDAPSEKKETPKKKVTKPVAESRPLIAKKDLRNTVFSLFSIPSEQRAELGNMVDSYADRLIKNGSLTEDDRKAFFDRMYDSGVMTMPANDYYAEARRAIKGSKIFVPDSVVADFGDDWNDIRRRAFGAGIYLTRARTSDGHSVAGIDVWNGDLAAELPGLFDTEETDERSILERIVQVAEEGKDEKLSLAEYTARLAGSEHQSEEEFLDNMERQLDWALRTFAEKARLEVHLRDRTGVKIAQEREGFATRNAKQAERQRAREAQRRADEREAKKDSARRARERKELRELQQRTLKQLQWLNKNRNRAPEELRATWDEVLGDIDLYAVSAADEMRWSDKHNATWRDLAQMYKDAQKNDPNFLPSKELERIVARLDGTKIADMDIGALQDLYKAAIGLRTEFYNRNNVINDEMQRLFAEVYTDAKREIEAAPGGFTGGKMDKLMNLDQLTPMNVLQRMGGWDPDGAFYSMAKQLERGERDMRAYSVKAQKMLQDFLTEHEDWVKKADGQGKDAIWYEVEVPQLLELGMGDKPIFGPTVKVYMTPAQKVHMFLESKNLDNLRHMTGGRTFVDKALYSQGKRQEALSQGRTIRLAPETVRKLVSDLTPEEMELARILDRYYNTYATQEINRVSNILYGYDKAMGKNYAPIYTNRNYTKTEFGVFDVTAEGVGNLKGRQYAVNPSYNISAFDAFERHVDQTARFCGMAIPARNWTTLMNWREKNNSTGDVITHKWGEESKRYITDLITTLQGGDDAKTDTVSATLSKLQSNYISAVFGANPSIVLKQLGSIPLAGAYLDAKNVPTIAQIARIDRSLISKYSQDLEWRTMGYATPETKQLKENPNWTQSNKAFRFAFGGGAITAMDGWAASVLWPWAENKVRREHPELALGTKAEIEKGESQFYKKVAEEFENAMSRSQSVSDEIHQGALRKSKNPVTRAFTLFRSDSAQTYNALRQKIGEAKYYARTGAKNKALHTAKKAAGAAFVALLLNAMWGEGINFLMALWKNKGKRYRDDDDELTFESVAGEMASGMLGSFAGVVTGGEELFEVIGNILTGDKLYDIETPGVEQLNDVLNILSEAGSGMRDIVVGGWDVVKNGGNLGEYLSKHSGEILGDVKELAAAAATYLPGLPVNNLEAYLVGALKWISPELGAAYDDLFQEIGKGDLSGLEGGALEYRVGEILSGGRISESEDTAQILAALYETGYKTAIPSDTPAYVSINGEKHTMGEYQQQAYETIWGGIVRDALDDMVSDEKFTEADPETQAKMLSNLYSYAAEQAKAELFDEYKLDSGSAKNAAIVAAGATVGECIIWNTVTSGMKSGEKSAKLVTWDIPEAAKRQIFRDKISDSREDSISALDDAGLTFDQFLRAYSKYGEINNMDLKAGQKAVEFSHWVNTQGYTADQAAAVKDELTYFNMTPASSSRYDELIESGMDREEAYDLTGVLSELQPDEGEDTVSDLQKWRASVDFSDDVEDQLTALSVVMTDAQFQKVEIANDFGVKPDAYVTLQEIKPQYDADGNGSYKQVEIQAAIDGMQGYYTTEQKAVLWQLATGSTSAKNNPYSRKVGQQVLDAREAAKEAAAQDQTDAQDESTDDDSFSQELLNQLLGKG